MLPPACVARRGLIDAELREQRIALLLRPYAHGKQSRRTRWSSRRVSPSPGACRRPCCRTCSTAPPGISRIASTSRKFDSGVGFSNGCAELTLKKPPPLVPSCLIAICEAAGPTAITCSFCVAFSVTGLPFSSLSGWPAASSFGLSYSTDSTSGTVGYAENVCTTPCDTSTSAKMNDSGSRMYSVVRVISTQKLPIVCAVWRAKPRISAITHRHAGRRGQEILHRERGHLGQIAHGAFAAVALPVGVGHEADRRVERRVGRHRAHRRRIERQMHLQALQAVHRQPAEQVEHQQRDRVFDPAHFLGRIDAAQRGRSGARTARRPG